MSDSNAVLRARIASATDLQSMARTMKTIAAANIGQYEAAVRALDLYYDVVQDSLAACLRAAGGPSADMHPAGGNAGAIIFGSDQGLVGQFNEDICTLALAGDATPSRYAAVWPVGERVAAVLISRGIACSTTFSLPASIEAVTALVGQLLVEVEQQSDKAGVRTIDVFHHRPEPGKGYLPVRQRLLPLDRHWEQTLAGRPWPSRANPQLIPWGEATLRACIGEYLFVSLYRACAESLASENAARLAAMQRAEKNIGERLQLLTQTFHRQRQGAIDAELFDLIAGFEAQQNKGPIRKRETQQNQEWPAATVGMDAKLLQTRAVKGTPGEPP